MNMKFGLAITISFVLGFFIAGLLRQPENAKLPTQEADNCDTLSAAKKNLVAISKTEYLEYTEIKDQKAKYEKADELLGKIMLLFLADIGFKLKPQAEVIPNVAMASADASSLPSNNKIEALAQPNPEPASSKPLSAQSVFFRNASSQKGIMDRLNESLLTDIKTQSARGNYLNQRQIKILEGRFTGTIQLFDKTRTTLEVVWDLIPDYSKNPVAGTFHLKISGPNRNSESNGSGGFKNITTLENDSNGFLVDACGGDCYLQLYYNSPSNQFYGNYYESKDNKNFARVGVISLRK
jgi:hypothetical protein